MSDLVEFLRARLDEDEQAAQQEQIPVPTIEDMAKPRDEWPTVPGVGPDRRVLREVEAKRQIIERCANTECSDSGEIGGVLLAEYVLAELALPYADHPDYRQEWRV